MEKSQRKNLFGTKKIKLHTFDLKSICLILADTFFILNLNYCSKNEQRTSLQSHDPLDRQ